MFSPFFQVTCRILFFTKVVRRLHKCLRKVMVPPDLPRSFRGMPLSRMPTPNLGNPPDISSFSFVTSIVTGCLGNSLVSSLLLPSFRSMRHLLDSLPLLGEKSLISGEKFLFLYLGPVSHRGVGPFEFLADGCFYVFHDSLPPLNHLVTICIPNTSCLQHPHSLPLHGRLLAWLIFSTQLLESGDPPLFHIFFPSLGPCTLLHSWAPVY